MEYKDFDARLVTVRYYGPTNTKGSRMRVMDNFGAKTFRGYDYAASNAHHAAVEEAYPRAVKIVCVGGVPGREGDMAYLVYT